MGNGQSTYENNRNRNPMEGGRSTYENNRNDVYCDQCRKNIGDVSLAWFSDAEKDLDFCSEECHFKWNRKIAGWKDIHPDFNEELQKEWEDRKFSHEQCKEWIAQGLNIQESAFASYLESKGCDSKQENLDLKKWRIEWEESSKKSQQWLEQNYLDRETKIIYINQQLEGVLDCREYKFPNLRQIYISSSVDSSNLEIKKTSYLNLKTEIIPCILAQTYLDQNYPKEERSKVKNLNLNYKNLDGSLDLSDFTDLTELWCLNNQLTTLEFLKQLNPKKLIRLDLNSNNIQATNLELLRPFVNLKQLGLGYNRFCGSLEPLQGMSKLEHLNIDDTDIDSGLEYLSESIESFDYSAYRKDAKVKAIEEELDKFGEPNDNNFANLLVKWKENKANEKLNLPSKRGFKTNLEGIDIAPLVPLPLLETFKGKIQLKENYDLKDGEKISYQGIYAEKPSFWKSPKKELLPIKLYNIKKNKVELTKVNQIIGNYAIVSYVWGQPGELLEEQKNKLNNVWNKAGYKNELNPAGYKSLYKAIETLKTINKEKRKQNTNVSKEELKKLDINYLWMDQLCINQNNVVEKNREVPKMGQYYSNAAVTLISIQSKLEETDRPLTIDIIEKIIKSEWFRRSWTFQEGWLSKHTIFMFDDILVDGRTLAVDWVLYQPGYSEYTRVNVSEASEGSVKIATPIGWVYFKNGYNSDDKISLTLSQVLRGIKEKNRTLAIDGIYSVLGMLPYGKDVEVNYKPRECSKCPNGIETEKGCNHEEKKWPTYTKKDVESALFEVIKKSWENGYGEALAWHGEGFDLLPKISTRTGSTSMVGGISVRKTPNLEKTTFISENIKINGSEYAIDSVDSKLDEIESGRQGFLIDSGLCARDVQIKDKAIKLWGTREALKEIKKGHFLIIPNNNEWESNIPFAILAEKKDNSYHRLGLVEIRSGTEELKGVGEKELVISMAKYIEESKLERKLSLKKQAEKNTVGQNEWKIEISLLKEERDEWKNKFQELENQLQKAQIEIPPKGNN